MSHLQKKPRAVIQVVDATAALNSADESHSGYSTIKRKQMSNLQAKEEHQDFVETKKKRKEDKREAELLKEVQLGELNKDRMQNIRDEVTELAKEKFSSSTRRVLEIDKLKAIGVTVKTRNLNRKIKHSTTINRLEKDVKYYKEQKQLGTAAGLANPKQVHRKEMQEKYGEKREKGPKLHNFGSMSKEGTLRVGKGAMKRSDDNLRKERSGGTSTNAMFKKFHK